MNNNETIKELTNQLKQRDEKIKRLEKYYDSLIFTYVCMIIIIIFKNFI